MKINVFKKALATICLLGFSAISFAETIAIIGTGKVASSLGPAFASLGHEIVYGSRNPNSEKALKLAANTGGGAKVMTQYEAVEEAQIVVLAVPWVAVRDTLRNIDGLDGKIVIDPTNPIKKGPGNIFERRIKGSAGEQIQKWEPKARVVKAFNTLSFKTMKRPKLAGGPVSIPLAGNDPEAKAVVAELAEGIGFEAIDVGPIRFSYEIEGMLILWINGKYSYEPFDFHMRKAN